MAREERAAAGACREDASAGAPDGRTSPDGGASVDDASAPRVVEEKVLTDEDMPSLESLGEDSDYRGFLSPGVSKELRRRALRKLFMSAVFNVRDGLDDYDEDFTSFEALGDIVTSDMKHQAEMEAERARQARADAETETGIEDESSGTEGERLAEAPEPAGGAPPPGSITDDPASADAGVPVAGEGGERRAREAGLESGALRGVGARRGVPPRRAPSRMIRYRWMPACLRRARGKASCTSGRP